MSLLIAQKTEIVCYKEYFMIIPPEIGMDSNRRRRGKLRRWEWKKAPGYPKRPLSAYNCFYRDERVRMVQEIPSINDRGGLKGMSSRIAHRWRALTMEMKQPYEDEATEEKTKYCESVRLFKESQPISKEQDEQNADIASNQTSNSTLNSKLTSLTQGNITSSSCAYVPRTPRADHTTNNGACHENFQQLSFPYGVTSNRNIDNNSIYLYPDIQINSEYKRKPLFVANDQLNSVSDQQSRLANQAFSTNFTHSPSSAYNHNDYNSQNYGVPSSSNASAAISNYSHWNQAPMIHDDQQINMTKRNPCDKLNDPIVRDDDSSLQLEYDFNIPFDDQTAPSGYLPSDYTDESSGSRKRAVPCAGGQNIRDVMPSMSDLYFDRNHETDEHQLMQPQQLIVPYTRINGYDNRSNVVYQLPGTDSHVDSFNDGSKNTAPNYKIYNPKTD